MATTKVPEAFTYAGEANADLSAKLHYFAKAVDGDKIDLAGDGATAIGTIIEAAAAGYGVTVQFGGIGKVIAAESIAANAIISSDTNGKAVNSAAGDYVVGVALNTAATSELCSFIFAPGRRHA